jgi:uncharacterized protein YebE (UPF0316 family)
MNNSVVGYAIGVGVGVFVGVGVGGKFRLVSQQLST